MWTRLKMVFFIYDLGIGVQQVIPNSLVITSNSYTSRNIPK